MVITAGPGAEPYEALAARRRIISLRRQAVEAHAHARSQLLVPAAGKEARGVVAAAPSGFEQRLERARQRNADAMNDVGKARAWLKEYGPQQEHQHHQIDDEEGLEDGLGDYKDLARRALRREQAAFRSLVEDEASLLSASFLRQLQLAGDAPARAHAVVEAEAEEGQGEEEEEEGDLWLGRRQRRARENERIVRRLFEQQRKVSP